MGGFWNGCGFAAGLVGLGHFGSDSPTLLSLAAAMVTRGTQRMSRGNCGILLLLMSSRILLMLTNVLSAVNAPAPQSLWNGCEVNVFSLPWQRRCLTGYHELEVMVHVFNRHVDPEDGVGLALHFLGRLGGRCRKDKTRGGQGNFFGGK